MREFLNKHGYTIVGLFSFFGLIPVCIVFHAASGHVSSIAVILSYIWAFLMAFGVIISIHNAVEEEHRQKHIFSVTLEYEVTDISSTIPDYVRSKLPDGLSETETRNQIEQLFKDAMWEQYKKDTYPDLND